MKKKTLRNDLILIFSLLAIIIASIVAILVTRKTSGLTAKIYCQETLVKSIDLDKAKDEKYVIKGLHGDVIVHAKKGAIGVIEADCPHHDCVNVGYVYTTNRPIVCAYNAVYIEIVGGTTVNDIEVG